MIRDVLQYCKCCRDAGYATTQEDVARDLYNAIQQFYVMFPEMAKNELYVTGESYAGNINVLRTKVTIHGHGVRSKGRAVVLFGA